MSFHKILVAVDRSSQASEVFKEALELAKKEEGSLMIFHCLNREDWQDVSPLMQTGMGLYPGMSENLYQLQQERLQAELKQAQTWLQAYCQTANDQGVPAEFCCEVQAPGPRICDLARTWGADLILLGRRGRKGLAEILLGSVSNYVVHHAHCSVLVAQGVMFPTQKATSAVKSTTAPVPE